MKYDWIKTIPNYIDCFSEDNQLIIELIGMDNYLKLFESFGKTGVYFSSSSITALKRAWAIKNRHIDYNEAARILEVSTKTIYNWRHESGVTNYNLFNEDK
jgi:hypothetical protein